jgi:hypothetical protein
MTNRDLDWAKAKLRALLVLVAQDCEVLARRIRRYVR